MRGLCDCCSTEPFPLSLPLALLAFSHCRENSSVPVSFISNALDVQYVHHIYTLLKRDNQS